METPSASSRPCALVISDAQMTRLCGDRRIRVPQPAFTTLFTCISLFFCFIICVDFTVLYGGVCLIVSLYLVPISPVRHERGAT